MEKTANVQSMSKVRVMRTLSVRGNCTRMDLAKATGLTPSAITRIIAELISKGIVVERGFGTSESGRRTINLTLNSNLGKIMNVKLSRSFFNVTVWDFSANIIDNQHIEIAVSASKSAEIIEMIRATVRDSLGKYGDIRAIGVTVPTPFYPGTRRIMAISDFLDWDGVDLEEVLAGVTDLPILIENDANASAWAEWIYRDDANEPDKGTLVSFIIADSLGIGVIQNSNILSGAFGTAGEIAHMSIDVNGPKCTCGNCGCLDTYVSGSGFARMVREDIRSHPESSLSRERQIDLRTIFQHMKAGDTFCCREVEKAGEYLGYALANIEYVYNPDEIVLTGIMIGGSDALLNAARSVLEERVVREVREHCKIRYSSLQSKAPGIGAVSLAMGMLFDRNAL